MLSGKCASSTRRASVVALPHANVVEGLEDLVRRHHEYFAFLRKIRRALPHAAACAKGASMARRINAAWGGAPGALMESFFNILLYTMRPPRQHTANSTAWVSYITNVPRDQVHVDMHARLTSGFPDVYPDVVPVRRMIALDKTLCLIQETKNGGLFFGCHVKEVWNMALGNYEYMPTAQRVVVVTHVRKLVLQHNFGGSTQLANCCSGHAGHRQGSACAD